MNKLYILRLTLLFLFFYGLHSLHAQVTISGTVYDVTKKNPVQYVSVISTSGKGTVTDSLGKYSINVKENDSIYFSYLNKPTPKFPVADIATSATFDISILTKVTELPPVFVKPRNYRFDSLENRKDYARIFNYSKPGLKTSMNGMPGTVGVGVDLDELIDLFRFRKTRRTLAFQQRLLQEEQDKYIDHRYSKALVRKLTGLNSPELEDFMKLYRPTYQMSILLNDLEFGQFVQDTYKYYSAQKNKRSVSTTH